MLAAKVLSSKNRNNFGQILLHGVFGVMMLLLSEILMLHVVYNVINMRFAQMPIFSISIIMNGRWWNDIAFTGRICDRGNVAHDVVDSSNLVTGTLFRLTVYVTSLEGQRTL